MPPVSLVVCLHSQGDLLRRLLENSVGCYDDLVVVHDGPDETGVRMIVQAAGGRFFERPREYQQEPHWPFAWGQAGHDWILRLDADEIPSQEMKGWLETFRRSPEPDGSISGFACFWPIWNKDHAVSKRWPGGRNFLFHRERVRFIGMVELVPTADGRVEPLDFVLRHEPPGRESHSLGNILFREQAYRWRECIARSFLGKPTDLACWRWEDESWPDGCENMRRHPLTAAISGLLLNPLRVMRDQWKVEQRIFPIAALSGPIHHALFCIKYWQLRRAGSRRK